MFSLELIVLPEQLSSRLQFLHKYNIEFGQFLPNKYTPIWLVFGFIVILLFKSSMEKGREFKLSYRTNLLASFCFIYSVLSLNTVSEFLYFNF
jgi:hypothetical protein